MPGPFGAHDESNEGHHFLETPPPAYLSRTVLPASVALSALRTLRLDFGDYQAEDKYDGHHLYPYSRTPPADDMAQALAFLQADPVYTERPGILERAFGKLRLDTLILTHSTYDCDLLKFDCYDAKDWIDQKKATRT